MFETMDATLIAEINRLLEVMASKQPEPPYMSSTFPVLLPKDPALHMNDAEFQSFVRETLAQSTAVSTGNMEELSLDDAVSDSKDHKMRTANNDDAFENTEVLVDLFFELEREITSERLKFLLVESWKDDPEATLKIIWNARSIHLGKAGRAPFYKACGWLADNHPQTFITNLEWLVRPVIPKSTAQKEKAEEEETVLLTEDGDEDPEIERGGAHGYWKDLCNLVQLAAHDQLHVEGEPKSVLNVRDKTDKRKRDWDPERAKQRRHEKRQTQHAKVVEKLSGKDPLYRALHLSVARLFAHQMRKEIRLSNADITQKVSLAGKWAPTPKESHDKSTFIASSIAEAMYPLLPTSDGLPDREAYLRHAREMYRGTLKSFRQLLGVVERHISAQTFDNIKYERVPSLAMSRYADLFFRKDPTHFGAYLDDVASGKAAISGATMLPSVLALKALGAVDTPRTGSKGGSAVQRMATIKVLNGQWKSLVQSIRDNGKLESSIAVCDVSGSMFSPVFEDKTTPAHAAIGLSLLLAQITEPPFGRQFITFSSTPELVPVAGLDDEKGFCDIVDKMKSSTWGMSTDLVAVFERLLLPLAVSHKVAPENMVKQVFVFTDMHFNAAMGIYSNDGTQQQNAWSSSFERIRSAYKDAGYEMPTLIFWNLAGAAQSVNTTTPKPVQADQPGTALVSGYSASQLKMFLEGGQFEDAGDSEDDVKMEDESADKGDAVVVSKEKTKADPVSVMRKAISHPAYQMLKVVD